MSNAKPVPETRDLTGDDAWHTIRRHGRWRLATEGWERLLAGDGFTHARSLAFTVTLVAIEGLIGMVGLASLIHTREIGRIIDATIRQVVPGPAGRVLTSAVSHAHHVAHGHHYLALVSGICGALYVATIAMGQLERGLNRIYGVEVDRPPLEKYTRAFIFALSTGTLSAASFACLALGRYLFGSTKSDALSTTWAIGRWPLGLVLITVTVTVLFRYSPARTQPELSWLLFGSGISVLLWVAVTAVLGIFYSSGTSFDTIYGPLAGLVALLVWSFLSSCALFYGAAVTAQLEELRSGVTQTKTQTNTKTKTKTKTKRKTPTRRTNTPRTKRG
jgi:YihY family inner membrane protein